ncbi:MULTISPECIES: hypothetical protein [unclassified Actinomyces]|uniref:hypothetical protein n=1 Tax=unclassified Actinomyces TaxID=2609248 RepID=UPI002017FD4F|nr:MULTISPECIES: hypothetical protein [unclassified Actinomyces]MCL3776810.1 hypothetical protein [Actinomyces sp. AC-20-1]MCL3789719.1 hypothetical protein [Actinomyces sp. 187325]MCL3792076.1 hypothetical protein [Actinomyces sp. 186855]MCL3794745.1 hypothetical protein [Actinomyces sp. 217892]
MSDLLSTVVVIDYQNVHLTAHDIFNRDGERHEALIHPQRFAQTVVRVRNERQHEGHPHAVLCEAIAFRGLPHSLYDWEQNRRCSAQAARWRADGATIELRDLKYRFQTAADGRPATDINGHKIPIGSGREKGIDVLVALTCLRKAVQDDVDLVITVRGSGTPISTGPAMKPRLTAGTTSDALLRTHVALTELDAEGPSSISQVSSSAPYPRSRVQLMRW